MKGRWRVVLSYVCVFTCGPGEYATECWCACLAVSIGT